MLEADSEESLRYAALELRMCIETLTYEKLRSMSAMIPESVLRTWQPPQAVKALLEFEPDGDRTFEIYAGVEEEYGIPAKERKFIGRHNSLKLKWLRKHYNKLGNFLHAPMPSAGDVGDAGSLREYLSEVVKDLREPLASSIFGGGMRDVYTFDCTECRSQVVVNAAAAKKSHRAVCFNPQCRAEFFASIDEAGEAVFQLIATKFECSMDGCAGLMSIENRLLDVGIRMVCPACGLPHEIVERHWAYGPVER